MLLNQLLLLNDLRNHRSIREAASALKLPESTLRSALHHLEDNLGCTLITTDKRGIHWTATGQQILAHTEMLRQEVQRLLHLQDNLKGAFARKWVLAATSQFGTLVLTEVLQRVLKSYPLAQFSLSMLSNQALLQALVGREMDLALMQLQAIEEPLFHNVLLGLPFRVSVLLEDHICFLVGPEHPLAGRPSAPFSDILQCSRLVSKDRVDALTETFLKRHGYHGSVVQISNIITLRQLVGTANYASWQTINAAKNSLRLYEDRLHLLEISDFNWKSTLYGIHRPDATFEDDLLMEHIRDELARPDILKEGARP